jgi:transcriptional regulator with XRE-family HTH domain
MKEMNEEHNVSQRIKKIRKALNFKQKEFAQQLSISGGSLSEMEKGKYPPNFEFLKKVSRDFNVKT